jgi:hypothetical protein
MIRLVCFSSIPASKLGSIQFVRNLLPPLPLLKICMVVTASEMHKEHIPTLSYCVKEDRNDHNVPF